MKKKALDSIISQYRRMPQQFNSIFRKMYEIGYPDTRKYCSPLQAYFWVAMYRDLSEYDNLLTDYSLDELLRIAWKFGRSIMYLSKNQIDILISSMKDVERRKEYLKIRSDRGDKYLVMILALNYKNNPEMFDEHGLSILENESKLSSIRSDAWNDFDEVVERLNAPELFDYYPFRYHRKYLPQSAKTTFKKGTGDCKAYAIFAYTCLKKAGYQTFIYTLLFHLVFHHGFAELSELLVLLFSFQIGPRMEI